MKIRYKNSFKNKLLAYIEKAPSNVILRKEIAELKERGEFENGFYNDQRLCDLNEVITIIKAQTKNNRTDEVYKYLPIASVACIESFFRATIKELLDNEVNQRNNNTELNYDKPDPLMVASRYDDEFIILLCALFAYGNAKLIVKFLDSLDFSLLEKKIFEMNKSYQNLLEKHAVLSEDFENLKVKYEEEHKKNQELTEEQKKIKLISA